MKYKVIGKIISYDNRTGIIETKDNNRYLFSFDNLIDKDIIVNDIVLFDIEIINSIEIALKVARNIKKYHA